jgi:ankyrin repeat protein
VLLANPKLKVDVANAAGETALMMAALQGRLDWSSKLIERGAKGVARRLVALSAARYGSEENVRLLIQRDADSALLNERNQSAADLAQAAGRPWLLPLLE